MNAPSIKLNLYASGYCTGDLSHVHKGAKREKTRFYALWALIEHPDLGKIILDTGYTHRFFEATKPFPARLYRYSTPVFVEEEEYAINQLARLGIEPSDIDHIVISHFHGDHVAGLKDFPNTPIWCSEPALTHVLSKNRWNGVFKGILTELLPDDLATRAMHPEDHCQPANLGAFNAWKWAEGIWFVSLPGHCRGQMGLYLENTQMGTVFLSVDATWTSHAFRSQSYPPRFVSLIMDNYQELIQTIDLLHQFHRQHPEVKILPTHCSEVAAKYLIPEKTTS